jgi:hypothetical protein
MSEPVTYPPPVIEWPPPPRNKWEREYRAFLRLLPELLKSHRGKYVAVHEERAVGSGDDKVDLAWKMYEKYGYVPIYVGLVTDQPLPPSRMPSPRTCE